jgi:RNA polymerase sigma-70 factor (ECF subfamily)
MNDRDWLAQRFESHRPHLRAVAYRMLGSLTEADDAVQDTWLRLNRSDTTDIDNLAGWLTTVVARLCLDMLRARKARREDPMGVYLPEPIIASADALDPEQEVLLADSVGLAMLVVLETLSPAERLAFVLHDSFGLPFDEIAPIVGRSPTTTRQLASRARRRVRGATTSSDVDVPRQREVVDAFVAAARAGDFEALLRVLDPDVVVRADAGAARSILGRTREVRGARAVAKQALGFRRLAGGAHRALVNGAAGLVVFDGERPFAVLGFTIRADRIIEIDILSDPGRLADLDLSSVQ